MLINTVRGISVCTLYNYSALNTVVLIHQNKLTAENFITASNFFLQAHCKPIQSHRIPHITFDTVNYFKYSKRTTTILLESTENKARLRFTFWHGSHILQPFRKLRWAKGFKRFANHLTAQGGLKTWYKKFETGSKMASNQEAVDY